jgi:osmoprotectant transport system ATP-binding protein
VGRDRGYRALGFMHVDDLPLHDDAVLTLGEPLRAGRDRSPDGWALVLDTDRKPRGWVAVGALPDAALDHAVTADDLNLGGTLAPIDGTLRQALDAALSSPSGRGVVVDPDGRFAGTLSASEVLQRIEERAARGRQQASGQQP